MAITLQQAKVGQQDKVATAVIELFQRKSEILDAMVFDDAISPQGGSTLAYTYQRELTPSVANGRAINEEYVPGEALREEKTTHLKIFGGSYEIDRVIANTSAKQLSEVEYQSKKKVDATINYFHQMLINGDSETNGKEFDGLNVLLEGSDTEDATALDITTMDDAKANALVNRIDEMLAKLVRKPDMIITNSKGKIKLAQAARTLGYFTSSEDAFGRKASFYDGIRIVDAGQYYNGSSLNQIVGDASKTAYYFVCFGQDELVGLSPEGNKLVETHLPDFTTAGSVKKGDVEAVWGLALKNTKAAGVIKNITVSA